jgi:hypothetical protein
LKNTKVWQDASKGFHNHIVYRAFLVTLSPALAVVQVWGSQSPTFQTRR